MENPRHAANPANQSQPQGLPRREVVRCEAVSQRVGTTEGPLDILVGRVRAGGGQKIAAKAFAATAGIAPGAMLGR